MSIPDNKTKHKLFNVVSIFKIYVRILNALVKKAVDFFI